MPVSRVVVVLAILAVLVVLCGVASAANVGLPNTSSTVTFTASVREQCNVVALPSAVGFTVNDYTVATNASAAAVNINRIVLADGHSLKLSLQANAASFTTPTGGSATWAASDVSWNAATWVHGTGAVGQLSNSAYHEVVTSDANAPEVHTAGITFTLAAHDVDSYVDRSGDHTLVATWKLESI